MVCTLWLVLVCMQVWPVAAAEHHSLEVLYVDANVGEAAGGHMALRLGDEVFHYQFHPVDKTFLLVREPWQRFRLLYNELLNRTIHCCAIPLTAEGYQLIRKNFTLHLVQQTRLLAQVTRSGRELGLLQELVAGSGRLALPFLGLFVQGSEGRQADAALHQKIGRLLGDDGLSIHRDQTREALRAHLTERALAVPASEVTWAGQLHDLVVRAAARELVAASRPLRPAAVVGRMTAEPQLLAGERRALNRYRQLLEDSIVRLMSSGRPGSGGAIVRQYARLQGVRLSLATGSLLTIVPEEGEQERADFAGESKEVLRRLAQAFLQESLALRALLERDDCSPARIYAKLAAVRYRLARSRAALAGECLERAPQSGFKEVRVPQRIRPALIRELARQRERHTVLQQRLAATYDYQLLTQNCVTKLLGLLNRSFLDAQQGRSLLGGWLETEHSMLLAIPHQAYRQIVAAFPQATQTRYPSRRLHQLSLLNGGAGDGVSWLRESNVLTSTLYRWRRQDTPFLFFTDDTSWSRPLFGVLNLGYGAAYSVGGVLAWPLDGGELLWDGVRGMFYSLPELVFANIRKGTYSSADLLRSAGRP